MNNKAGLFLSIAAWCISSLMCGCVSGNAKQQFYVGSDSGGAKVGLRVFDIDAKTGILQQTANTVSMVKPLCFVFAK